MIHRPIGLQTPAWPVRIGAPMVMGTDAALVLYGRCRVSRRLEEEGFDFEFPLIGPALRDLYKPRT